MFVRLFNVFLYLSCHSILCLGEVMVLILLVFTIVDLCPLTLLARDLYLNIKEGHLFMALA